MFSAVAAELGVMCHIYFCLSALAKTLSTNLQGSSHSEDCCVALKPTGNTRQTHFRSLFLPSFQNSNLVCSNKEQVPLQ